MFDFLYDKHPNSSPVSNFRAFSFIYLQYALTFRVKHEHMMF